MATDSTPASSSGSRVAANGIAAMRTSRPSTAAPRPSRATVMRLSMPERPRSTRGRFLATRTEASPEPRTRVAAGPVPWSHEGHMRRRRPDAPPARRGRTDAATRRPTLLPVATIGLMVMLLAIAVVVVAARPVGVGGVTAAVPSAADGSTRPAGTLTPTGAAVPTGAAAPAATTRPETWGPTPMGPMPTGPVSTVPAPPILAPAFRLPAGDATTTRPTTEPGRPSSSPPRSVGRARPTVA